jgi:deoxyribodipyrimidine photo-lyase
VKGIGDYKNYDDERNLPALKGTTLLGPHNKFGTVSIREVYHLVVESLGVNHTLIRELYWRDFFTHIAWHFPHVFGHAFHRHYDAINWSKDMKLFNAWSEGRTGYPIVDAGMRELVATGFMHNRVRMIVASFLVKDLHLNWRWGEAFFARHLTDYDPAVNNGSWQWAASTGCDAQPYFRIFNPWLQQKRFDAECVYIRRWVPELKNLSDKAIHELGNPDTGRPEKYPHPIVEHALQKIQAEEMFRACQPSKG